MPSHVAATTRAQTRSDSARQKDRVCQRYCSVHPWLASARVPVLCCESACPLLMPPKYHPTRKGHALCSSVGMRTLVCDATFWKCAAFTTIREICSCVFQVIAHYAHRCRDAYRSQIRNSTAPHQRRGYSAREPLGCSACWRRLVAVHRVMRRSRWAVIFERSAEWTTRQHSRTFPISGTP